MKKVIIIVNFILIFFIGNLFNVVSFEEISNKNINNDVQRNTKTELQLSIIQITPTEDSVTIDYVLTSSGLYNVSSFYLVHPLVGSSITQLAWNQSSIQSVTENNLESNTTYSDWYFLVSYRDSNNAEQVTSYPVLPFKTTVSSNPELIINNISTSKNSATIQWTIVDPKNLINSIMLYHPNVGTDSSDVTNLNKITINGLNPNTTYNDWYFEITYNNNQKIKFNIEPFMTDNIVIPSLTVQKIVVKETSVTLDWTISDPDSVISSIILYHPHIGLGSSDVTNLTTATINGLSFNATYNDWYFTIKYDVGLESASKNIKINSFTTNKESPKLNVGNINVSENSVTLDWSVNDPNNSISLITLNHPGVGSGSTNVTDLTTITINNLKFDTTYSDWFFTIEYNIGIGTESQDIEIRSFKTNKEAPKLSISNVTILENSVTLDWTISDPNNAINSVILNHPGVGSGSSDVTSLTTTTIDGLNSNTAYNNWFFTIKYSVGLGNESKNVSIDPFTTIKSSPVLNINNINASENSVTINWSVSDPNNAISLIILNHPGIGSGSTDVTNSNTITINNLTSNTTYTDWSFTVEYNVGLGNEKQEVTIDSFITAKQLPKLNINNINASENSVTINWSVSDPNNAISLIILNHPDVGSGSTDVTNLTEITIDGLNSGTFYGNWYFEIIYDVNFGNKSQNIKVNPFNTIKELPIFNINNISTSENSVTLDWNISDPNNAINSVILNHPGIGSGSSDVTDLTTIMINDLNFDTTYNDWNFTIEYNLGLGIKSQTIAIDSFTTTKETPKLNINNINASENSVTLDWNISDPNNAINSVILHHPNVGSGSTDVTDLTTITIDGLSANTTYDNWYFDINYEMESSQNDNYFAFNFKSSKAQFFNKYTYIIISILLLLLIIVIILVSRIILLKKRKEQKKYW